MPDETSDRTETSEHDNLSGVVIGQGKHGGAQKGSFASWIGNNKIITGLFIFFFAVCGGYIIDRSFAASSTPTVDFQISKHQSSDSRTIASGKFSTSQSNELLEAFIDSNGPGSKTRQESFQTVTGGGLTWTLRVRSNTQSGDAEIWQAVAAKPVTNATITATRAFGSYSGDITVVGFIGANTTTNGATAAASARSGVPTVSLTTTEVNSWVWATGFDWDNNSSRTVGSNQSLVDQYVYRGESITSWTQSQMNPANSSGTKVTLNDTSPNGDRWDFAAIEILPSNTSSPTNPVPPTAPTNLTGSVVNSTQVSLSWTASTDSLGVAKYTIYRVTSNSTAVTAVGTSTTNTYTDTTSAAGTTYTYYVVASTSGGLNSPNSSTVTIAVPSQSTGGGGTTSGGGGTTSGGGGTSTGSGSGGGTTTSGSVWQPPQDANWMWELSSNLDTTNANLMGTGITAYNGDTAPGDNPVIYDIDAINNPASTVTTLHNAGDHVICYIEVGTAGDYYAAADEGLTTTYYSQLQTAGDLSSTQISGYPENYININQASAVTIMESMIKQQCAQKGFDAVETDLDETFGNNDGNTPWTITQAQEEAYLTTLANYMHSLNLGWIAKNLDDTGIQSFVTDMQPLAQGIVTEQCNQYSSCSLLAPFETAHKWIGNAEYAPETQAEFCSADNAANINGVLFNVNLNGGRAPCR
jgi:hypothetical protein